MKDCKKMQGVLPEPVQSSAGNVLSRTKSDDNQSMPVRKSIVKWSDMDFVRSEVGEARKLYRLKRVKTWTGTESEGEDAHTPKVQKK